MNLVRYASIRFAAAAYVVTAAIGCSDAGTSGAGTHGDSAVEVESTDSKVPADDGVASDDGRTDDGPTDSPPAEGGRCPAYPSFPDASCTGTLPGTTLAKCSLTIREANAKFNNCLFDGDIQISPAAKNVTITNSKIRGIIVPLTGDSIPSDINLTLTDVEADGVASLRGFLPSGATCIRCNIHHYAQGIYGGNLTVVDSYVHDIYGEYDCAKFPGDCISHNEAVMARGGLTIVHSNLDSVFSENSTGGGMSTAVAMYTHGSFWGPVDNVKIEKSRINAPGAIYCMYAGNSSDTDGDPSNIVLRENVFVSCNGKTESNGNAVVGWLRGSGNVWQNNRWGSATGVVIPEPPTTSYN